MRWSKRAEKLANLTKRDYKYLNACSIGLVIIAWIIFIIHSAFWVGVAVFLFLWANNLSNTLKDNPYEAGAQDDKLNENLGDKQVERPFRRPPRSP